METSAGRSRSTITDNTSKWDGGHHHAKEEMQISQLRLNQPLHLPVPRTSQASAQCPHLRPRQVPLEKIFNDLSVGSVFLADMGCPSRSGRRQSKRQWKLAMSSTPNSCAVSPLTRRGLLSTAHGPVLTPQFASFPPLQSLGVF